MAYSHNYGSKAPPQRTVIVQQSQSTGGLFSQLEKAGNQIGRELDKAGMQAQNWWDGQQTGPLLNNFLTGNIIALISRSTGKCLQIVQGPQGLVLDGMGFDSPQSYNAHWTVVNLGNNIVRLHNNNNYIVIANGATCLMNHPAGVDPGIETQLRLSVRDNAFVIMESVKQPAHHVGITPDGRLKPAMATGRQEMHSHFACRIVYSPYPHPGQVQPAKR